MPDATDSTEQPGSAGRGDWVRAARRWGPFVGVAVAVLVAVVVFRGGGDDDEGVGNGELVVDRDELVRSGPMTPLRAELEGIDLSGIDFGPNCDPETERIKLPTVYAPPCVELFEGDNGGATAMGVTEDTIKLVLYIPQEDPMTSMLTGEGVGFDPDDTVQAAEHLVDLYNEVFETYGRRVELEIYEGSGASGNMDRAQADAIAIAEMEPFAVLGGPFLANVGDAPFVDELAARRVVCLPGCAGTGLAQSFVEERDPYVWPDGMTAAQTGWISGEALGMLTGAGTTAELAGDPDLQDEERVIGLVHFEAEASEEFREAFEDGLGEHGVEIATEVWNSLDLSQVQDEVRNQIVQLKEAEVTTVVVTGAPFTPAFLTQEATNQDYWPEWVLGPNYFADTRIFGGMTDQEQWVNGFGLGFKLTAHPFTGIGASGVYEWAYGEDAVPIPTSMGYLESSLRMLFTGVHLAGPELTPEDFRDGLFRFPPSGGDVPAAPTLSWGDHGSWPEIDYGDQDDVAIIWWDPEATNHPYAQFANEGRPGYPRVWVEPDDEGFWRLANGGQRYKVGEFPASAEEAGVHDDDASALMYGVPLPPELEELFDRYDPPDLSG